MTRLRLGLVAGLVALLLAGACVVGVVAVSGVATAVSPVADAYGRQVFRETNLRRDHADVALVTRNRCLQAAAVQHAVRMARGGQQSEPDRGAIRRECGLKRVLAVVAGGFPSGRATVRGWMQDHRARDTLLRAGVTRAGTAARRGQNGTWFAVLLVGREKPPA